MKIFRVPVLCFNLIQATAAFAGIASELTSDQQRQLNAGEMLTLIETVPGHVWPRVKVYQILHTEAEAAAAFFWDFEDAKNTTPDVKESRITRRISPREVEVFFVTQLPFPLKEDRTTFRESLQSLEKGAYSISWTLVSSDTAHAIQGSVRIEPHGTQAVISYDVFVDPAMAGASLFAKKAVQRTIKTIRTCFAVIENTHRNPAKEQAELQLLRQALR